MQEIETFKLIERISTLLKAEERKKYAAIGLQPIHGQVLEYIATCNKYSNTHASVAEYLGLTKGTVSTSIQILERKNLLSKVIDPGDARVSHIFLTKSGALLLEELKPLDIFRDVESKIAQNTFTNLDRALQATLHLLQVTNQHKSFGLCRSCLHFTVLQDHYLCTFNNEPLQRDDTLKICRDHTPLSTEQ